jgi:prolyl 4-hydroxylase
MLNQARTSTGMFFNRREDDVIERIEERVAAWTMLATKNGEGIQVLQYEVRGLQRI